MICGFGRTGNYWGSETFGMKPDILSCAKALSSSYMPISAVMISDAVYQPIANQSKDLGVLGHGYTYTAHPVCADFSSTGPKGCPVNHVAARRTSLSSKERR